MTKWATLLAMLIIGAGGFYWAQRRASQARAFLVATDRNAMKFLNAQVSMEAAFDPLRFASAVGTGVVADATSLPRLFPDLRPVGLRDARGRPLHVRLSKRVVTTPGEDAQYDLIIWSDGPNGVNDQGLGDDVSMKWVVGGEPR